MSALGRGVITALIAGIVALSVTAGARGDDAATAPTTTPTATADGQSGDTITVTLDAAISPLGPSGRVVIFFIAEEARFLRGASPIAGPFFMEPQPIISVAAAELAPGGSVIVDDRAAAWPVPLSQLDGSYRVQALLRCNPRARAHVAEGNIIGPITTIDLEADRDDAIRLTLDKVVEESPLPEDRDVAWVDLRSERLSAFHGRETRLRAGVVFPPGYHDIHHPRRTWPTIYVIPGFGGTCRDAVHHLRLMQTPGVEEIAPMAVHVILDPDARLGHHGFADSEANGPVGTALVDELIPYLEERFRLVSAPEARLVTGHSSGGWSALWLQLHHPEVFGACWSSAPDPVDFSAFQNTDLYRDESIFTGADGTITPSYRRPVAPRMDRVLMTVAQEIGMEWAMSPEGESGEQWDAWAAMFSPRDPQTNLPVRPWDPITGLIDREVIESSWSAYDIARIIASDWARYGPILRDRVRLACGERDSFYLNRAVERLQRQVWVAQGRVPVAEGEPEGERGDRGIDAAMDGVGSDTVSAEGRAQDGTAPRPPADMPVLGGPGYIWIVPRASHESIVPLTTMRWNQEMIEHLRRAGLHE